MEATPPPACWILDSQSRRYYARCELVSDETKSAELAGSTLAVQSSAAGADYRVIGSKEIVRLPPEHWVAAAEDLPDDLGLLASPSEPNVLAAALRNGTLEGYTWATSRLLLAVAPATPMMTDSPHPLWQHSRAWRMTFTLPMHSKL